MDNVRRVWMRCGFILLLLLPLFAEATIYKSKSEDGRVIYSDKPMGGNAEAVTLPPLTQYRGGSIGGAHTSDGTAQVVRKTYYSMRVVAPKNGQTFQNIGSRLDVALRLRPQLHPEDVIVILLDSHKVKVIGASELHAQDEEAGAYQANDDAIVTTLDSVWRGEHVLSAQVENAVGEVRIKSQPVTIYVHQASQLKNKTNGQPLQAPTLVPAKTLKPAKTATPAARG